mmetsp:Transcript_8096/g.14474  ORF Transcript_8096/g.14474 Transcript_8096/m.14474 type:complete len:241 (+) Transcript_8096:467-1189(+)
MSANKVLVVLQGVKHLVDCHGVRDEAGETSGTNNLVVLVDNVLLTNAEEVGDLSRDTHTDGNGLTMEQRLIAMMPGKVLDGMGRGMAILRHHLVVGVLSVISWSESRDLLLHAFNNKAKKIVSIVEDLGAVLTSVTKRVDDQLCEVSALAHSVLKGLSDTIENVAVTERLETVRVHDEVIGRVVATQEVLTKVLDVEGLLEITRGIAHTHGGGRDGHELDTTIQSACNRTCDVVYSTTSE